ncbi:unnamed protein product, partial [Gadus morhua 'NCC']
LQRSFQEAGREDGRKKSYRLKISAQKGLELLQQHPALKDQVMYRLLIQVNPCRPTHIQSICEI